MMKTQMTPTTKPTTTNAGGTDGDQGEGSEALVGTRCGTLQRRARQHQDVCKPKQAGVTSAEDEPLGASIRSSYAVASRAGCALASRLVRRASPRCSIHAAKPADVAMHSVLQAMSTSVDASENVFEDAYSPKSIPAQ